MSAGWEVKVLRQIDSLVADRCFSFIQGVAPDVERDDQELIQRLAKIVVESNTHALEHLIQKQAALWSSTADKIDRRWNELSKTAGNELTQSLQQATQTALESFAKELGRNELAAIQAIDIRYQQWQTTLSDQSRHLANHHDQLVRQSELLTQLIESCEGFAALDATVQQTLGRMTNIDRFHEAAVCMTEAIAVLGIQLERSGEIGKLVRETPAKKQSFNLFEGNSESMRDAA